MVRIVEGCKAHHRNTGYALQHFGDAIIRQQAGLVGDDRVDHRLGIPLAVVGTDQRFATRRDHDLRHIVVLIGGLGSRGLSRNTGRQTQRHGEG